MKNCGIVYKYVAVILLIICSNSLIFFVHHGFFLIGGLIFALLFKIVSKSSFINDSFKLFIAYSSLIIITTIFHGSIGNAFIHYIVNALFAYLIISSLNYLDFKKIYLDVVFVLCISSIVVFFSFRFLHLKASLYEVGESTVAYAVFYHCVGWTHETFDRIAGLFTEPGAYQFILNFALILHLDDFLCGYIKKNQYFKLFTIIVTLLLVGSTTGYIVLCFLMMYVIVNKKIKSKILYVFFVLMGIFIVIFLLRSEYVVEKLSENGVYRSSFLLRQMDNIALINMIMDEPLIGNGINSSQYISKSITYSNNTSSNGVLAAMAMVGVMWLILYFYYGKKACKKMCHKTHWLFFVLISLLVQTNENFSFCPIIYIFLYSYSSYEHFDNLKLYKKNII